MSENPILDAVREFGPTMEKHSKQMGIESIVKGDKFKAVAEGLKGTADSASQEAGNDIIDGMISQWGPKIEKGIKDIDLEKILSQTTESDIFKALKDTTTQLGGGNLSKLGLNIPDFKAPWDEDSEGPEAFGIENTSDFEIPDMTSEGEEPTMSDDPTFLQMDDAKVTEWIDNVAETLKFDEMLDSAESKLDSIELPSFDFSKLLSL